MSSPAKVARFVQHEGHDVHARTTSLISYKPIQQALDCSNVASREQWRKADGATLKLIAPELHKLLDGKTPRPSDIQLIEPESWCTVRLREAMNSDELLPLRQVAMRPWTQILI